MLLRRSDSCSSCCSHQHWCLALLPSSGWVDTRRSAGRWWGDRWWDRGRRSLDLDRLRWSRWQRCGNSWPWANCAAAWNYVFISQRPTFHYGLEKPSSQRSRSILKVVVLTCLTCWFFFCYCCLVCLQNGFLGYYLSSCDGKWLFFLLDPKLLTKVAIEVVSH